MELSDFQKPFSEGKIRWTTHGLARMQSRGISIPDVANCVMNGEIIEEYPNDYPHPSALIFGHKLSGEVIHVVCGIDGEIFYFITAYEPTPDKFAEDLRTRRQK